MDNLIFFITNLDKVVHFDKNTELKLQEFLGIELPKDYIEFIQNYKILEGSIGEYSYVCLWGADDAIENNIGYKISEFHPNLFLIGSDMGGMGLCINKVTKYYIQIDLCSIDEGLLIAKNFREFIEYLYNWSPN
jgi:hypothetical protein